MTKSFCDRCRKETNKLKRIKISCGESVMGYGDYKFVSVDLCEDCQKQTGVFDFIDSHKYEKPIKEQSDQDRFFELFREMVMCSVEDING